MESLTRQDFIVKIGSVATLSVLAGCTTGGDDDDSRDGDNPETSEADVVLEYSITADKEPEEMPEDIRDIHRGAENPDGRREEGHKWVVVSIEVVEGTLNMEDVWFRSRLETSDRFYNLDHASGELTNGIQSRGSIQEGGSGLALYQIPEDENTYRWNIEEMRQDVQANER